MYVLAVESATPAAGVALINEHRIIAEKIVNNQQTHSQNLLPMIDETLQEGGLRIKDIDLLTVSLGPGSFTGLRIGFSLMKTLAQVNDIPLTGISTLDVIAGQISGQLLKYNEQDITERSFEDIKDSNSLICPVLNARRNEVYAAYYTSADRQLRQISDYRAVAPEKLARGLSASARPIIFAGDGLEQYRELFKEILGELFMEADYSCWLPRPSVAARLGLQKYIMQGSEDLNSFLPLYLRDSDAKIPNAKPGVKLA